MISSPFLLAATIKNHLTKAGTPIAHQIADNMYVDNMITGVEASTQADDLYREAKTLFQSASMNLREWASNSSEFLQKIPECDRTSAETMKVLGTPWNLTTDTIFINGSHNLSSEVTTKREALHSVSRIYDPLGLFSPATLNAKLFIQELWKQEKDWDETFSQSNQQEWSKICESLTPLCSQPLPRYIGGDEHKLFCFTDSSAKAYSAALYLYSSVNGKATVNLVFSKARVAPSKELSIPRLELLGVLIGTRCLNYVTRQLQLSLVDRLLWRDSQCVLHWMKTSKPFAKNRIDAPCKRNHCKARWLLNGFLSHEMFNLPFCPKRVSRRDAELISLQFKPTKFQLLILERNIHILAKIWFPSSFFH